MSDTNSAHAALISNISERDRTKDMLQFHDIWRTFINETNKFENRFGIIRDKEKMLEVAKLMFEASYNSDSEERRCRTANLSFENVIFEKFTTVPTARNRKIDTSAPMEIGMAAKGDGEHVTRRRATNRGCRVAGCLQRNRQRKMGFWKGSELERKRIPRWQRCKSGREAWQKGSVKKGSKGQEKGGKGETRACWTCGKTGHMLRGVEREKLVAIDEDDSENVEEATGNEEDLQAWCLSEESENEQWQEVTSRRGEEYCLSVSVECGETVKNRARRNPLK